MPVDAGRPLISWWHLLNAGLTASRADQGRIAIKTGQRGCHLPLQMQN